MNGHSPVSTDLLPAALVGLPPALGVHPHTGQGTLLAHSQDCIDTGRLLAVLGCRSLAVVSCSSIGAVSCSSIGDCDSGFGCGQATGGQEEDRSPEFHHATVRGVWKIASQGYWGSAAWPTLLSYTVLTVCSWVFIWFGHRTWLYSHKEDLWGGWQFPLHLFQNSGPLPSQTERARKDK